MSDFATILKFLAGSGGGPVGTQQEPWNPAARIAVNPMGSNMPAPPQPLQPPNGAPEDKNDSFGTMMGKAMFPQSMKATQGKGG